MEQDNHHIRSIFEAHNWDYNIYNLLIKNNGFDSVYCLNTNSHKFGGLHVRRWGNFGNSVTQLVNLAAIAKKDLIPVIYFETQHPFFDVSRLAETTGVPFIHRSANTFEISDGIILSGFFYFDMPFKLFNVYDRQPIFDAHISPLLPVEFTADHPLLDDKTITMHFRAGDNFDRSLPSLPWYGQPPLAYYKFVLDHSSAEKVVIVYEDKGNPTVEAFTDYVRLLGREVVSQSADLRSDLAVLFNSRELVSSIGTFVWSVSTLSKQLKRFWFFERIHDHSIFARSHISISRIHDEVGDYTRAVLSANWAKTPEQLKLMLDYPTSALMVTRGEAAAASSVSSFDDLLETIRIIQQVDSGMDAV